MYKMQKPCPISKDIWLYGLLMTTKFANLSTIYYAKTTTLDLKDFRVDLSSENVSSKNHTVEGPNLQT